MKYFSKKQNIRNKFHSCQEQAKHVECERHNVSVNLIPKIRNKDDVILNGNLRNEVRLKCK
jgi:hypothetical protein